MRLATAAWLACATHALAAAGSLLLLRPGAPVGPDLAARAAYVTTHLAAWRAGWLLWTLASLSLVLLLHRLARGPGALAAFGLLFDLPSQLLLAWPRLDLERLAYLGTGVAANSIYTLALAWALWRAPLPRPLALGALPSVVAGVAVTLASLAMHPGALFVSTGILAVAMIAWTAALGVHASRASS